MPTLDWIGKKAVVNHHKQTPFHLIRRNDALSAGARESGNLLVEGDNLLALKALLPYYGGQVKCIYIDPPYNTGNENWIYNDNVNSPEIRDWLGRVTGREAEDLSRHDKWLCMMYPRLALLKEFLREDGAIFITVDDSENAHLRLIMDEIFGSQNQVPTVIWQKVFASKNSARTFSESHDYLVVYARNIERWKRNLLPRTVDQTGDYKNADDDPRGPWNSVALSARNPYSQGVYPILTPSGRVIEGPPKGRYWSVSLEKFKQMDSDNRIWWGKKKDGIPRLKVFLSEAQEGIVPSTIWFHSEAGNTQEAKKELLKIFPDVESVFPTPKPIRLIKRIMQIASDKDSIVLDSFAGSGTTGHAVLQMNKEDGGNRKFILVEMDSNICRSITSERLRRAIDGYSYPKQKGDSQEIEALGGGFDYCEIGNTLFDPAGQIRDEVSFEDLARHVFFIETGQPLSSAVSDHSPLVGVANNVAVYLLYNRAMEVGQGENVLTASLLAHLPPHDGLKVVYGSSCRIGPERLRRAGVTFRQIPYEVRTA